MSNRENLTTYNEHRRSSSRKRCLSELQETQPVEIFETLLAPFPSFFHNIEFQSQFKAKIFKNKIHFSQQIFTYVFLVCCFENKNEEKSGKFLDYVYQLIEKPQFQFLLPERNSQLYNHTHMNLKNIISQYLNCMSTKSISVMKSLNKYPLMLQIFTTFFRTLLFLGEFCLSYDEQLDIQSSFQFFTSYFDVQVTVGQKFIFFPEVNVYAYQQNLTQIIMFYPNDQQQISSFTNRIEQQVYRSGISSVNMLISSTEKQQEINITTHKSKKPAQKKRVRMIMQKINDKRVSIQKKFQAQGQINDSQFSKFSYNYTESQPNKILLPLNDSKSIFQSIQRNQQTQKKLKNSMLSLTQNQMKKQANALKSQKRISGHYRNKSQFSQYFEGNKQNSHIFGYEALGSNTKTEKTVIIGTQKTNKSINYLKTEKQNQKESVLIQQTFYRPVSKVGLKLQSITPWVNKNITKQYTSSFVLSAMPQPYRTNIKMKKQRARQIRKSAYNLIK